MFVFLQCQSVHVSVFNQFYFSVNQVIPIALHTFIKNNSSTRRNIYFHHIINFLYMFYCFINHSKLHTVVYILLSIIHTILLYLKVSHSKPYCCILSSIRARRIIKKTIMKICFTKSWTREILAIMNYSGN